MSLSPEGEAAVVQTEGLNIAMNSNPSNLSQVQAGYDRWSAVYDHDANPLPALEEPIVQRAVGSVKALRVLDLGCGTGRHALWLADAGAVVTAVDFSAGMMEEARRKPGSHCIEFIGHDLHQPWPFKEGSFDLVVSGLVLEHLSDLHHFFSEIQRTLRTEGRAIISAMHPAMFLRGSQVRFTDPHSGEVIQPGSRPHTISDFVHAALSARLVITAISEHAPDAAFAERYPRAAKYVDWPMLLVMQFHR